MSIHCDTTYGAEEEEQGQAVEAQAKGLPNHIKGVSLGGGFKISDRACAVTDPPPDGGQEPESPNLQ